MGEVAMSRPEFEAVVRLSPTDQHTRFINVPRRARQTSPRKWRRETVQFFSRRIKKGSSKNVETMVRMAEKAMGDTSRKAILAKG